MNDAQTNLGEMGGNKPRMSTSVPPHFQLEWCRATLASIGDAVITTDSEGRVTYLNPVAESLTGWTLDEAAGVSLESVFKIVIRDTRQTVESPTVRALRDGVIVGLANHTLLITKDGTERPIDHSAAPIRSDNKEVAGVVLVFRDITELNRLERAKQEALAYADDIIATVREPFLVLDSELRVVTGNRSFYENFHVTLEETQGRFIFELGNGQWDIPKLRLLLEDVLPQNHALHDYGVEHDFPTIGPKYMLLNARRIRKPDSHSELILLAIEDITERKRAAEALVVSEIRYRRLFEAAKDGILILDTVSGRITDANPFMGELLGYTHEEFVGKELWEIGLFSHKSANEAVVRELQEKKYVRFEHLPLETEHGRRVDVEVIANVHGESHRSVIQCNIRDISERRRMEKQLQKQVETLADMQRRKDEFLAMLSHELRNPLAPISNAVEILRLQENEDPLQKQARTIIKRQTVQLTRLVDDLLDMSRINTGRIHLQQERVTLNGIVNDAVESVRPMIGQHRHSLNTSLPPDPIFIFGDASRLQQVIVNLLTNAVKYTNRGGHIWLSIRQEGDEAVLRLRDTGVGIAPELLPRIFDMFTQAERSLDRSEGGLGIGLCLVQRLVEMHRGRVEAHSSLGQGSEFVVWLPVFNSPDQSPVSENIKSLNGPALRVLVVDDSVDSAQSLATLLKMSGHDVRTAYDGSSALEAAINNRPSVVLLDIGLPGMNGYEVAKQIRQQANLANIVLVAVTGYGQESDRKRSQEAGFDHHLVKPINFAKVQQVLATVFEEDTDHHGVSIGSD